MPDSEDKYATFNRDDVIKVSDGYATFPISAEISDAVVIRRQDKFASPALATYAAMIAVALSFIDDPVQRANLLQIADYFEHQAQLAADEGRKIPDV